MALNREVIGVIRVRALIVNFQYSSMFLSECLSSGPSPPDRCVCVCAVGIRRSGNATVQKGPNVTLVTTTLLPRPSTIIRDLALGTSVSIGLCIVATTAQKLHEKIQT